MHKIKNRGALFLLFLIFFIPPTFGLATDVTFDYSIITEGIEFGVDLDKDTIQEYCSGVQIHLIWLIFFVMFLWILEPIVIKKLSNLDSPQHDPFINLLLSGSSIPFFLKWIGVGTLFIIALSLWYLG